MRGRKHQSLKGISVPFLFRLSNLEMSKEETKPEKSYWYQRVFIGVSFGSIGFLGLGAVFGSIRYSLDLVNPVTTYIGTIFIVLVAVLTHFWLKRRPLPWVTKGQEIRIKRLGIGPVLGFAGACLLLWVPRLISDSKTDAFQALALTNARKNLMSIHLRLDEMYDTVRKIGTRGGGDNFRSLPDHLVRMGSLDLSFCRSLESHVTELSPEFLRAATAYCGTLSNFTETESNAWATFDQTSGELLRSADDLEAQLVLACLLGVAEKNFYILKLEMTLYSAKKMGLTEHDLLVGSQELGLPDIPIPSPFIETYVHSRFHADCETGKIVR
jgi:hypothetical protein